MANESETNNLNSDEFLPEFQENPCIGKPRLKNQDEFIVSESVGSEEEESDEIADRDRDIPMLYDRNRIDLMNKRDRQLRKKRICQPPPDVIYSPNLYTPSPGKQVTR